MLRFEYLNRDDFIWYSEFEVFEVEGETFNYIFVCIVYSLNGFEESDKLRSSDKYKAIPLGIKYELHLEFVEFSGQQSNEF